MPFQSRLEVTVDSTQGEQNLKRFRGQLNQTEQAGVSTTQVMSRMKMAMGAAITAAGGLSLGRIIRETRDFQQAMLGVQAVSGATADQYKDLEAQARTLGATTAFSAQQAASAQEFLARAGMDVNEVLSATPEILKLAVTAQMDLGTAADLASNALGQMQLPVSELDRVVDVLAATSRGANTNVIQLGEALSNAGPLASAAGINIETTAAAIGVLSDSGIQGSRAGTGLLGVIRQLTKFTPQAEAALDKYNLSTQDVSLESHSLADVLDTLREANISVSDAFTIFGSEAGAASQVLINGADRVRDFTGTLEDAEGVAGQMAQILGSGLAGSIKTLNSVMSESILQMGEGGIGGSFGYLIDNVAGVISVYNGMIDEFQESQKLTDDQVDNLENVATAAAALAAILATRTIVAIGGTTSALIAKTAASINDARAEAAAATATVRRTAAERQAAFALLSTAQLEARATAGTNAHMFALNALSAARTRATGAAAAHTAATNVAAAAMTRASVAGRSLAAVMGVLGGPVGLFLLAAGAAYYFRDSLTGVEAQAQRTRVRLAELTDGLEDWGRATLVAKEIELTAQLFDLEMQAVSAKKRIDELSGSVRSESIRFQGRPGAAAAQTSELEAQLRNLQSETGASTQAMEKIRERLKEVKEQEELLAQTTETTTRSLEDLASGTGEASEAMREAEQAAKEFENALGSLMDKLFPVEAAQRKYKEEQLLLTKAWNDGRITADKYTEAMRRLEEAQLSSRTPSSAYSGAGFGSQIGDPSGGMGSPLDDQDGDFWGQWLESAETALTDFDQMAATTAENFQTGFGKAFESMIMDSSSLREAAYHLFDGMARSMVRAVGEMIAQWLTYQAVQLAIGKTTEAASIASAAATGSAIAGAYAPAAANASLATFGANTAAAMAGITATHSLTRGLSMAGMAHDGIDRVPTEGTWLLDKGERVLRAPQADKLDRMMERSRKNEQSSSSSPNVDVKNVNVFDSAQVLQEAMSDTSGQKVFLNYVKSNRTSVRSALGI